ncbi:MAG: anaerobic ribonucleoside-triphosphate reductase [Coriobacteriia bacterium]
MSVESTRIIEAPQSEVLLTDEERTTCEVWTRVMGYHRPVSSFNKGKQGEYAERMNFAESDAERC